MMLLKLTKAESVEQHLMTCYPAEVAKPGELVIHYAPEGAKAMDFVVKIQSCTIRCFSRENKA